MGWFRQSVAQSRAYWSAATKKDFAVLGILYLVLASCCTLVMSRRWEGWESVPLVGTFDLNQHYTNAALSCLLVSTAGVCAVLYRRFEWRTFLLLATVIVLANAGLELVAIPELNVPDLRDTAAGILGTAAGILVTLLSRRVLR